MSLFDRLSTPPKPRAATAIPAIPATPRGEHTGAVAKIAGIAVAKGRRSAETTPPRTDPPEPTEPRNERHNGSSGGFVGLPLAGVLKIQRGESANEPGNCDAHTPPRIDPPEPTEPPNPDRYCWPHSPAMNTHELDLMAQRLERFTAKGLSYTDAEGLADSLMQRDRDGDDRRTCWECAHLRGYHTQRCSNHTQAGMPPDGLAVAVVALLKRCSGFQS
jgi:hypothetical protein